MGSRHFDLPRRTRSDLIVGFSFVAIGLAMIAVGLGMLTRMISSPSAELTISCLVLVLPVPGYFVIARRRRQLLCRAMIEYAERHYLFLDRLCNQAGAGLAEGGAEARRRWLAEIDRFIDRYLGCISKPGDIKIINEYRPDLILAIDQLVVQDVEA